MRVLFIQHAPDIGGSARSLRLLLEDGLREGWEVFVVVRSEKMKHYYAQLLPPAQIAVVGTLPTFDHHSAHTFQRSARGAARIAYRLLQLVPSLLAIRRLIRRIGPDILYLNSSVLIPYLPGLPASRIPCVVHVRERVAAGAMAGWFRRLVQRHASLVVYISPAEQRDFPVERPRAEVVYNYIRSPRAAGVQAGFHSPLR
ncbi:MAG: hypothetical protein EPO12_01915, partial [Aquabacterium sp.]